MPEKSEFENKNLFIPKNEWEKIIDQLTRLGTATRGASGPTPAERLNIALEVNNHGFNETGRKYSLSYTAVRHAVRDTTAVIAYLSGNLDGYKDINVLERIKDLEHIDRELLLMKETIKKPEIENGLKKIPHVSELFSCYFRWRTVKPVLESLGMPYDKYQLRSVGRYFKADTVDESLDGLAQLARRYSIAKWLHSDKVNSDAKVSEAAIFVLTDKGPKLSKTMSVRVGYMKEFLVKVVDTEYKNIKIDDYNNPEDLNFFPKEYSGTEQDAIEVYRRFGKAGYCPLILKQYANMCVHENSGNERIKILGFNQFYSKSWFGSIDWSGLKFLEDTLIWRSNKPQWSMFAVDTGTELRKIKEQMLKNTVSE